MLHTGHSSTETGVSGSAVVRSQDQFVSDEARKVLEVVFFVALCGTISLLGSAVNVFNAIVFFKQGFSDSVNISLFALAVSDLVSLLPLVWVSLCFNPLLRYSDIDFDSFEINYLTGGLPHSFFVRTTCLITAFITFERCVCIALPLKVKNIITPKRTLISIVVIFIIVFATIVPLFSSIYLAPSFYTKRNKTLIGTWYTNNTQAFENLSFSSNVTIQLFSFIIVIICTVILYLNLLAKSQWRQKASSVSDVSGSISVRDKRVMKMIAFISTIFIFCYLPNVANLILVVHFNPKYRAMGPYANSYRVAWPIINTLDSINSSVNILVYYNMSSKFRATLKELLHTQNTLTKHLDK